MFEKLLAWRWGPGGKLGLGALLGLLLIVIPAIVFISLDLAKVTRQVEPPPFLGDWKPEQQQICEDLTKADEVAKSNESWHDKGWDQWPTPSTIPCEHVHEPAPDGTVRWHSCDTIRVVDGVHTPPCALRQVREQALDDDLDGQPVGLPQETVAPPAGATWVRTEGSVIVAADIYLQKDRSRCTAAHEEGHARGFVSSPEEDAKTPYVNGSHTERPGHLLGESCGDNWSWLDRRDEGDWPYTR